MDVKSLLLLGTVVAAQFLAKEQIVGAFKKLEHPIFPFHEKAFSTAIAIATGLFTSEAIMTARKTMWTGDDSIVVVSIVMGILYGFTAKI
jgi:hypothetical protein